MWEVEQRRGQRRERKSCSLSLHYHQVTTRYAITWHSIIPILAHADKCNKMDNLSKYVRTCRSRVGNAATLLPSPRQKRRGKYNVARDWQPWESDQLIRDRDQGGGLLRVRAHAQNQKWKNEKRKKKKRERRKGGTTTNVCATSVTRRDSTGNEDIKNRLIAHHIQEEASKQMIIKEA